MKTVNVDKTDRGTSINYTAENGCKYGHLVRYDKTDDTVWINGEGYQLHHRNGKSFDECIAHIEKLVSLPESVLSRKEYIEACELFNVDIECDEHINSNERAYSNRFGDFDFFQISEILRQMRYRSIQEDKKPAPIELEDKIIVIADCGHKCNKTAIMFASLGTACPDCYDKMSD